MAKRGRKPDPEETARRKLADALAKLQAAQEKRTRIVSKGEQDIESARLRAAARVETATREVERRASKVARAEGKLLKVQNNGRNANHAGGAMPPRLESIPILDISAIAEAEPATPESVAAELELREAEASDTEQPGEIVVATDADSTHARLGAEARALEILRTQFSAGGATFTAWLNASGISRKTFLKARKTLADEGAVVREGSGPGARYRPAP